MNPSPEHQASGSAQVEEPSPQAQLPTDLLDSSPEIGVPIQDVSVTTVAQATTSPQVTAAAQSTTTSPNQPLTPVRSAAVDQGPRHHDFVVERNERMENELWTAIAGGSVPPPPESGPDASAVADSLGEPGPEEPTPSEYAQPHPSESAAIFLPPGDGRTPEQRAAAARFVAAATARARQREEAGHAQQGQPLVLAGRNAVEIVDQDHGGDVQMLARETSDHNGYQQQIRSQNPPDQSNDFLPYGSLEPAPALDLQDQQIDQQPPQLATSPVPSNTSRLQQIPGHDSQASAGVAHTTVLRHDSDSFFNQMMNSLIAAGTAKNLQYRQVRLPPNRPIAYGMDSLYYGEWAGPDHELRARAAQRWSAMRAIRSARNGMIVGWQDSDSPRAWKIRLFPTHNPGQYAPQSLFSGGW